MNTEIQNSGPGWLRLLAFGLSACFLIVASTSAAAQQAASQIIITKTNATIDVGELPAFELHLYGVDEHGNALDLSNESFTVIHDGEEISDSEVDVDGPLEEGTFTLFFIDLPKGVAGQIPALQEALQQYAGDPHMLEAFDNLAIYRVGEFAAKEIVAKTNSHATIQESLLMPLEPNEDATALLDSVGGLFLESLSNLQVRPEAVAHVVVVSDGSDMVSSQYDQEAILKRAAEKGVPVHTVLLDNPDLSRLQKEKGQEFLAQLAADTRALAIQPTTPGDLIPLWQRIAAFRNRTVLRYTLENVSPGAQRVEVILQRDPEIKAETNVTVPTSPPPPRVVIDLSQGDRSLLVPNLDEPRMLAFSTIVTWSDGDWRPIEKATLIVNGETAEELDAGQLEYFEIGIDKFNFGNNELEIALKDSEGSRGTSPVIVLKIEKGDLAIPEALTPRVPPEEPGMWQQIQGSAVPFVIGLVVGSLLLLLLIGIIFAVRRSASSQRNGE